MKKSLLKTVRVAYLHPDGHLVLWHETKNRQGITTEWVTLHKQFPIPFIMRDKGRLIIGKEALPMMLSAQDGWASAAKLENGSEATKEKGLRVGTLALNFGNGCVFINLLPGVISFDVDYQTDCPAETWADVEDKYTWSTMQIDQANSDFGEES